MKLIKKLMLPALSAVLLSSCAIHSGLMQSSASLSNGNFKYVDKISGSATATYWISIGGLDRSAIVEDSKADMLKKQPLQDNQALTNLTANFKHSYIIIYEQTLCTVSADVVEFEK